jgi:type IV pilus assembly protein PilO
MSTTQTAVSWTQMDLGELWLRWGRQLKTLNPKAPQEWPAVPKFLLLLAVGLGVLLLLWLVWVSGTYDSYRAEAAKEEQLRADFQTKHNQAVNLDSLKLQREQIFQYVTQLEQQLPSTSDIDVLLTEINQAGKYRGLQFELLRPGKVVVKAFHAELPIELRVTGSFHQIGLFASDVAQFSRIVTINNLSISSPKDETSKDAVGKDLSTRSNRLTMEATAKTFRYLDAQELKSKAQGVK